MLKALFLLVSFLFLIPKNGYAEAGVPATMVIRNAASTTIPSAYSQGTPTLLSNLKGVSNLVIFNGSSGSIAVSSKNAQSCGSSTVDNWYVPTGTGLKIDRQAIGAVVCIRGVDSVTGVGSSITNGIVTGSVY